MRNGLVGGSRTAAGGALLALSSLATVASAAAPNMPSLPAPVLAAPALAFRIEQPDQINAFIRQGKLAAQLVLRAGTAARVIIAFPAGDSGIGIWLHASGGQAVQWQLLQQPKPLELPDPRGRPLRGLSVDLEADVPALQLDQVLLSSVRVLRSYEAGSPVPQSLRVAPRLEGERLDWSRDRLDGAAGYHLSLEPLDGAHILAPGTATPRLEAAPGAHRLRLRLQALSGDPPLAPLGGAALLRATAASDARQRDILQFLSYRQKFLAGAWRFDTYFGRDTLYSLMLLAPVLQPAAIGDGIDSVLMRLSAQGEVAHEEAIGEEAILLNEAAGRGASAAPVYDYSMLDEDFLLAPLVARWLLESPRGRTAAAAFLAARDPLGEPRGQALLRNLRYIVHRTRPFALTPDALHLIGLKRSQRAGDWRDSDEGLDGGRYPFDVNVVLAPAALQATQRLLDSGLLQPYLSAADAALLARAAAQWQTWQSAAPALFDVSIPRHQAIADVQRYAHTLGVGDVPAVAALEAPRLRFQALALDAGGRALPVMHSDGTLELLLSTPSVPTLASILDTLMRPFPAGLMTPIGLLVANPAFADGRTQRRFGRDAYHGTVVWAWQQAVLLAGIERQLGRHELPASLRARLQDARTSVWRAIDRARALRGSELWSWSCGAGGYRLQSFHPATGEAESDAAQLWSTVFLALRP